MTQRPSYAWSTCCAWGLTIAVGALTVSGVLAMFLRLGAPWDARLHTLCVIAFASVAALALANANNAAAAAMHACSRQRLNWPVFLPASVCAIGFCGASVIGVHLGWEIMARGSAHAELPDASQVLIAAAFLAFAKPAMSWVIEGRRAMDNADAHQADQEEAARLDAIRKADLASRAPNVTRLPTGIRNTVAGAAAFLSAGAGAHTDVADAAPMVQVDAPQAGVRATHQRARGKRTATPEYELRLARAKELLAAQDRISNRAIARETHLSPSTVDRLARGMAIAA